MSWKLFLIQDDSNQQQNGVTQQRIKLDEEHYLGVNNNGTFAIVQNGNASKYIIIL